MPTGVELQFRNQCDNLGAYRSAWRIAVAGRNSLWAMVDAAGNQAYEDAVKGTQITAVDTRLGDQVFGNSISEWFRLHRDYFNNTAGITDVNDIDSALTYYRWRVPQDFNELYYDWKGRYLTLTNVFPKADLNFGTYARTGSSFTDGDAVDTTVSGLSMVMAEATTLVGASNITVTATLKQSDDTTIALGVTFTSGDAIGTQKVFGETALSGNALAAATSVSVASTAAFEVGDRVLIYDSSSQEHAVIESIVTNTSITFTAAIRNAYTTAASAKITPLFKDVTSCTHTNGTNGDEFDLKAKPDRTIAI